MDRSRGSYDHHGTSSLADHFLRNAAQEQSAQAGAAMRSYDDGVAVRLFGFAQNGTCGVTFDQKVLHGTPGLAGPDLLQFFPQVLQVRLRRGAIDHRRQWHDVHEIN
jgi:hypothetical protein